MSFGLGTFRRAPISGLTAVTVVTALVLVPVANANAAVTPLVAQAFTGPRLSPNEWYLPPAASGHQRHLPHRRAPRRRQLPIPGCNLATADASGAGTLRLTPNTGSKVGSTFYQTSLPTSAGLDIKFDTYQYNATSASGADGIGFALTAVDPANPTPPVVTGPVGGSLGYTTTGPPTGIPYGYLGYGADAWGNFANSTFGGAGCALPAGLVAGKAYPENLTVRGPGNGTTGYCILGTTASTYALVANGGGSGGTVSNLGGGFLDVQSSTTRPTPVAAEIAMNPTNAAATHRVAASVVPANSYLIQVTPYTCDRPAAPSAPRRLLTGLLPTTANNTVARRVPVGVDQPGHRGPVPGQLRLGRLDRRLERDPRGRQPDRHDPERAAAGARPRHDRQRERQAPHQQPGRRHAVPGGQHGRRRRDRPADGDRRASPPASSRARRPAARSGPARPWPEGDLHLRAVRPDRGRHQPAGHRRSR